MYVSNFKTFVILFPRPSLTSVSSWSGRCWSFGCFFQPKDLTGWGTFGRGAQESYAFQVFGSGKSLGTQLKHTSMRFHELQSLAMHVLPPVWSCMISWSLSPVQKTWNTIKLQFWCTLQWLDNVVQLIFVSSLQQSCFYIAEFFDCFSLKNRFNFFTQCFWTVLVLHILIGTIVVAESTLHVECRWYRACDATCCDAHYIICAISRYIFRDQFISWFIIS